MDKCKKRNAYLIGNINLTNATLACKGLENSDPRWIGVVKEHYMKPYQGNYMHESCPICDVYCTIRQK